ncbi:hypothetical protein [Paraburkholderia sp. GAS334]|jgi:hypothetical protein|uniref:hypothetical protein n=1 Tax=unclassified Paraburkholderia TaxID=2615204 RepID=UPI003D251A43
METYRNLNGDSGVVAYEIGDDFVAVRFRSTGDTYWYTRASVGARHVAAMKKLALGGRGLSTYISSHPDVRDGYERKDPAG